jgi:hypothetical protein
MRFNLPILRRISEAFRKRDWFGIGFELFVVVLGVLLGLQASRWAAERDERQYQAQMVNALDATLKVYVDAGDYIHDDIGNIIGSYNRKIAAGERPPPLYWRLDQLERPPTLAWDAMVATGFAKSIDPPLVFHIARFFSRGDGLGDRYQRYNAFTENQILPYLSTPARFYQDDGKLRPEYAAHIDRMREILAVNDELTAEAVGIRKALKAKDSTSTRARASVATALLRRNRLLASRRGASLCNCGYRNR